MGWQAKYFDILGNTQWSQLDGSVKNALDKHPALVRYYVCVPLDRADARIPAQKSAMERWDDHVEKWQAWAQDGGMNVEFVWWGSSELIERLSNSEHIGRLFFWFGQRGFDQEWFRQHLDEAIRAAGPRYTLEIHVDLPIAKDMERFSRSGLLVDEVKSLAIGIRRAHDRLVSALRSLGPSARGTDLDDLSGATSAVLDALSRLELSPADFLTFVEISKAAEDADTAANKVLERIQKLRREQETPSRESRTLRGNYQDPFRDLLYSTLSLQLGLQEVVEICDHADSLANAQLLLLKGEGGTGKTHLLCDFAKKRVDARLPTVLLMGQRFLSEDTPWVQLTQHLDLTGTSAEEFVGALESSAQAADCRALVIIDALNEGNGRQIWPAHLSPFLTLLEKSPWIGVVLSVRSSYEKLVVPDEVRDSASIVTHHGFEGYEYDATQTFFAHYGLEFPSTPILQPEFSNPLFLKTLCKGLSDKGERRIPRGFQGITAVFDLYLGTVNDRLAKDLDYNPGDNLVRDALDDLSKHFVEIEGRWLARPVTERIVNELLPGRGFSNSLYHGLVAEGVLVEDRSWSTCNSLEEVVSISYDRLADHIIADYLLRTYLDIAHPDTAFAEGGSLAFIQEERTMFYLGLLEALCIQVPEHTGQELVRLAPGVLNSPDIGDAFLESIVWRKLDAFSEDTHGVLNELMQGDRIGGHPLDTVLSVSTVPEHQFNADFLDRWLRQYSMPDRDSWWSTYLHRVWDTQSPVDRLVAWASSLSSDDEVDTAVVDLAATTIVWMFTTPNRFLRDRATKALVTLLTGRTEPTARLMDRFSEVDDPYVLERVYAVAFGIAMRSHDAVAVGKLASLTYRNVFASGAPPAHILLRDYARGVVERAIYLGSAFQLDQELIRPPYRSVLPSIPCEDCVEGLFTHWEQTSSNSGNSEWSRDRIRRSVTDDDFSHYVIGDGSSSRWLALKLDQEPWQSPEERRQGLVLKLSDSERVAWEEFMAAKASLPPMAYLRPVEFVDECGNVTKTPRMPGIQVDEEVVEQALMNVDLSYKQMMAEFTEEHRREWEAIQRDEDDRDARDGPRFDKRLIQRYILWRVFDLGWTKERFGSFDDDIHYVGRTGFKAERMGKKYQWIAYHEILAYTSDHYQYRDRYSGEYAGRRYEGPWQEYLRDIDPSCTLKSVPGGTSWSPRNASWWETEMYEAWDEGASHRDWLAISEDLPDINRLLEVVDPRDSSRWLNVNGNFVWRQPHPAHEGPYDQNRRELGIGLTGYFVHADQTEDFMAWAKSVDFWGRWMPEPPSSSLIYLGEYGWAPAFKHDCSYYADWIKPESRDGTECPVMIQAVSSSYLCESGDFDCSVEDTFYLRLPSQEFIDHLGLQWSGNGADYLDATGELASFDPTVHGSGPDALLLRKDLLDRFLKENGLALCWVVLGEKWMVGGGTREKYHGHLKISGAYSYTEGRVVGFLNCNPDIPSNDTEGSIEVQSDEGSNEGTPDVRA